MINTSTGSLADFQLKKKFLQFTNWELFNQLETNALRDYRTGYRLACE